MGKGLPRSMAKSGVAGGTKAGRDAIDAIAALTGTLGTANDAMEAVTALSTAGGNTYTDAAVNAKLTIITNNFADVQAKLNAVIAALKL
jgi:hypothetical protein